MKLHHLFENEVPNPNNTNPWEVYRYACNLKRRIPELEHTILKDPEWAFHYAKYIIKGRWPEAEPYIMKDPYYAYYYADEVIKGRWPEAEPYIMKNSEYAYRYASDVIKGRWPEAEPYIMKDPQWASIYACYVIKGRWPEAEPFILKDDFYANDYLYFFPEARNPSKDVPLVIGNYAITDIPNTITDEQLSKLIKLIDPSVVNIQNCILSRMYFEPSIKQHLKRGSFTQVTIKQLINNEELKTEFLNDIECSAEGDFE